MPVEARNAITVCTPSGRRESRTLEEYQASIIARYGKLPAWDELAKGENRAMWTALGWIRLNRSAPEESDSERRAQSKRATRAEKSRKATARILACLTRPKTAADIERETEMSRNSVGAYLRQAREQGLVTSDKSNRWSVWQLAKVAA